jgi:hypothetical protein
MRPTTVNLRYARREVVIVRIFDAPLAELLPATGAPKALRRLRPADAIGSRRLP